MKIEDGKGKNGMASVSVVQRLNVSAKANPRAFYISRDDGLAFNMVSIDASADAGDYIAYLKNTSATRNLYVQQIHLGAANAALWKLWEVTGTAAGSNALTPKNLNLSSGRSAEATARGDGAISGLTAAGLTDTHRTVVAAHSVILLRDALILGPGDAIAVEYDTGTTGAAEVSIEFHYETIGAT